MGRYRSNAKSKSTAKKADTQAKVNGIIEPSKKNSKRKRDNVVDTPLKKVKLIEPETLIENGVTLTVGTGDIGQLGLGPDIEEKTRPGLVPDIENVVAVAAGGLHSCCVNKDGKVYTWGCNDEGALGRLTESEEDNFTPGEVSVPGFVVQISAGDCHTAVLTKDGKVYAWGTFRDNSGPLGFLQKGIIQKSPLQLLENISFTKISSGNNHLAMLTDNGLVYTCGCGESGQLGRIAEYFASRNTRDGKGIENQLKPMPLKLYEAQRSVLFSDVWAGGMVTFVKSRSSTIYAFGLNNYNQLGYENTNTVYLPKHIPGFDGKDWKHISPGQHHTIALDSNGVAYVMGRHEYGRLGLGENKKDASQPTPLSSDGKVTHVSAGECVSMFVLDNGTAYGFGMGTNNQLSQGNDDDLWEPTPFSGKQLAERKVITAHAGGQHTILLAIPK